jgi:hypothetical protein
VPDTATKAELDPRYLLIALLPALVFVLNKWVITNFAIPYDVLPPRIAEFDVNREGAARVGVLATYMLSAGASLGALVFFAYTLRMFDWPRRIVPFLAFLAMGVSALAVAGIGGSRQAHEYSGLSLACVAAGYDKAQSDGARARERAERPSLAQADGVDAARLFSVTGCGSERFAKMRSLGAWQYSGLVFAFAGLVIGAVCCLATRPAAATGAGDPGAAAGASDPGAAAGASDTGSDTEELRHWETQSGWLNTYLYLGALLLGTALMFINAYFRWPAYVLIEPAGYHEHSAALLSFYGVVFTVMLAAFYIPVATILAGKVKALKAAAQGESKLPDAFKGPLQLLKIVLGLFSTALAGALPGIIDLIS